ncbi:MAG: glucan 1,4-alpha-glucosidase [Planctomycetes bacterium RBG_13_44_8b]|nr:MAG: glucan 1,4-alpha-glucosidase [Planctomycetes bacterium RBG_13_44_8b]
MLGSKLFSNYCRNILLKVIFILTVVLFINTCIAEQETKDFPFLNPELSIEQRVDDLVGRMTLDEKIGQMVNEAPAIERLGIPEYDWWNECLHGVARAGLATVFPQAIGLGATWDEDLMFRISSAISDEARAKHHDFVRKGKRFIYQGLTFWSPNINIFRDPRWGRGQETYGEDPFLTGRLAVQFIKGLQGDDPEYFKTITTVKHFAVHSGPEPERHSFNAVTNERDFRETYLPQFEMGIKEGKAFSVMCAYNRYNGEVCCGSNRLLNNILRNEWGFDGYIVSDCGAIWDFYVYHKIVSTPEEAAALAVKSGCDLNCGQVYRHLNTAVSKNLITEKEIDIAVKRLFTARFKLGMFDPPELVKYTQIPYSVVDCKKHQDLALEAARKSIVLLKNEKNLLPLNKTIKTIAVIGPNSDQWLMLLGNYNGVPSDPVTPLRGIKEKVFPGSEVLYAQGCELAEGMSVYTVVPPDVLFTEENKKGLKVEYFTNRDLSGTALFSSIEKNLDANWRDKAPRQDMDDDNFSVRWIGLLKPARSGTYQLGVISTCSFRLYLNDAIITSSQYRFRNEFGDPRLIKSEPIKFKAGQMYKIVVEAEESYADAQVQLVWAEPKPDLKKEAIETAKRADLVVMCMGLTPTLEGEQLDIEIEGFKGGDRTRLDLPVVQQKLIKKIHALGKPVILVLLNGSALATNWEKEHIPAIIEAWYPGQAAGQAIADVIFGDYNPAGRLPVTFYKSVEDLPPFKEYNISRQTYRYFKGKPLYPFGYGLSYTSFRYDNLKVAETHKIGETVRISVNVKNTGELAGDEVVQLYLSNLNAPVAVPARSLKGFRRIYLLPGEAKTVEFSIPSDAFSIINEKNEREILPGQFEISVGGRQPVQEFDPAESNVLKARITLI